jgi:hypothetical protein
MKLRSAGTFQTLHRALVALGCALVLAFGLAATSQASAARPLTTGLTDIGNNWDRAVGANIGIVGVGISWRSTAPTRPAQPRNPADPAYDWSAPDAIVRQAQQRGLPVLMSVTYAPDWAEGPGQDRALFDGTWKPDASAFNDFAHALAQHYSGNGNLPRVRYFEPWAEPNLPSLLEPQYQHGKPVSPEIYRRLANAFYAGAKSVHRDNLVIGPALAPFGDPAHNPRFKHPRMRPVRFLRQLLCLKDRRKLKPVSCPDPVSLDVISHHALGPGPPTRHAINPDDAGTADLGRIMRVVRAAQRHGTIRPKGIHRKLWATEFWWISDPPSHRGVRVHIQARWVQQSLYLYWKARAKVAIQQPLRDLPGNPFTGNGLLFSDGRPKPSYTAFSFPFVTDRRSKSKVLAWGKSPATGTVKIQLRKGHRGWKTVKRRSVRDGEVFKAPLRIRGKAHLRAKVGSQKSLSWKEKG